MGVAELALASEEAALEAQSPKPCPSLQGVTNCCVRRRACGHSGTAALSGRMLQQLRLAWTSSLVAVIKSSPADPAWLLAG